MKSLRKVCDVARNVYDIAVSVFSIAAAVWVFFCLMKILVAPLAPIITAGLVLLFTLFTFTKWTTAVMSIGAFGLYAASWPISHQWGIWQGQLYWLAGVLTWFAAVYLSFAWQQGHNAHTKRACIT